MTHIYTYSEARQNLATLLDQAVSEGEIRIKRRDGQLFIVQPITPTESPLDVAGVDLGISADEIIDFIKEGRREM